MAQGPPSGVLGAAGKRRVLLHAAWRKQIPGRAPHEPQRECGGRGCNGGGGGPTRSGERVERGGGSGGEGSGDGPLSERMTVSRSCRPAPPAHEQAGRGEGHDKQGGAAWAGLRGDGARAGGGGLVGWSSAPLAAVEPVRCALRRGEPSEEVVTPPCRHGESHPDPWRLLGHQGGLAGGCNERAMKSERPLLRDVDDRRWPARRCSCVGRALSRAKASRAPASQSGTTEPRRRTHRHGRAAPQKLARSDQPSTWQ